MQSIDIQDSFTKSLEGMINDLPIAGELGESKSSDYVLATVTAGLSVGPRGANVDGWITYADGVIVRFVMHRIAARNGLFAGGGALPLLTLRPALLVGTSGTGRALGVNTTGLFNVFYEKRPAFLSPLPVVGVGIGPWIIEGDVGFTRA